MERGQDPDEDETVSSEQNKADEESIVLELFAHDVLLGRGTGPNEHQGNKILRSIVAKFQEEYDTSPSRKGRHDVAIKTLEEIKKNQGRFLERAASLESSSGEDEDKGSVRYLQVNDKKAINKIKQAFRYNIQTTKYAKRGLGESLQEEFHDNKRSRLLMPALPAALAGGGGFDGASSGEHLPAYHVSSGGEHLPAHHNYGEHLPAHHSNYSTTVAPNPHQLDMVGQQLLRNLPFAIGHGIIRDPIPPSQLARLEQLSIITPGLAGLDQRLGVGSIGSARSMMEYPHLTSRAPLYGMVQQEQQQQQQRAAYEASLAASSITMGGVSPFLSSLASTQSFGARSPHHYPLNIASAPVTPAWLRIPPAVLPPANQQLRLARDILLPPNAVHPLAAAYRPFLAGPEVVADRRETVRPSEIRSNTDAEDVGEEYRIARSAYDSHYGRPH
jgi:hypothetical protein